MLGLKMQESSMRTNKYNGIVCVETPDQIHEVAAQLAGVSSILVALRFQMDDSTERIGDSLFALQKLIDNLNSELCNIADLMGIIA